MNRADEPAYQSYLAAVRAELGDLPDDERSDLLDDVEQHLLEVSAEADGPLEAVLGPPERYAAELRAAAGLPVRGADGQDTVFRRLDARLAASWPGRVAHRTAARLDASPTLRDMRDFLPELRPGWWVLRGYLAVVVLSMVWGEPSLPIPHLFGNPLLGLIAAALAIRASVAWGRRETAPRLQLATWLGGALIVVLAMVALGGLSGTDRGAPFYETAYGSFSGLMGPNGEITNIYAYSPDGRPLDVLLYDQNGRPITTGDYHEHYAPYGNGERALPSAPQVANLFPRPAPIIDPRTGEVVGEKSRPVVIPPSLSPSPTPTPTATPTPSATPAPTPTPTPTRKK